MQVAWASICREFIETDEGLDVLGLGVDGFDVFEDFPVKLPLNVVYELSGEAARPEGGGPNGSGPERGHTVLASVFGPDMQLLEEAVFPAPAPLANPRGPAAAAPRRLECLFLPLVAVDEGDYLIRIQLDGEPPATAIALSVRRADGFPDF